MVDPYINLIAEVALHICWWLARRSAAGAGTEGPTPSRGPTPPVEAAQIAATRR